MPEPVTPGDRRPERTDAERSADHAAIGRLSDELLPALIAKLGATGLGELEIREGGWRVRLRRPTEGAAPGEALQPSSVMARTAKDVSPMRMFLFPRLRSRALSAHRIG